jgi:hypothetical protein
MHLCREDGERWPACSVMDDRMHAAIHIAEHVIGAVHGGIGLSVIRLDPYTVKTAQAVAIELGVHLLVAGFAAEIVSALRQKVDGEQVDVDFDDSEKDFDCALELLGGAESPVAMVGVKLHLIETVELIRANRKAVSAVAMALLARGTLDWGQVCEVLAETRVEGWFTEG